MPFPGKTDSQGKQLLFVVVVVVLSSVGAAYWRWFVLPSQQQHAAAAEKEQKRTKLAATSSQTHYRQTVRLWLDSFAGYWTYRSKVFRSHLAARQIKLELTDDRADYSKRYQALASGEADMALITIDADIITSASSKASDPVDRIPGTIVLINDETKGGDGAIGYRRKYPDIDSLNRANTKFVLTPNSPSESLTRVLFRHFNLGAVDRQNCFLHVDGAKEVYDDYKRSSPTDDKVWVLWSPYTSKMLENPNLHVIVDSSRFRGYIMDVLVTNRDFLLKHPDTVREVMAAHFRTAYESRDQLPAMVKADSLDTLGFAMSDAQAEDTVRGIWWKNFNENLAQMGLVKGTPLQDIDEVIAQINDVLLGSGAIKEDPSQNQPNLYYYTKSLDELVASNFHPGIADDSTGTLRHELHLPALNAAQWTSLQKVGKLTVPPLEFARGTDTLLDEAKSTLDMLVKTLRTFPTFYVTVVGDAATDTDPTAVQQNRELALSRAKAAEQYLRQQGIETTRVRAIAGTLSGQTQVSFVLGQQPY